MPVREFDSSFGRLLNPDFSACVKDGRLDAHAALDLHIAACDVLLTTALALCAPYVETLPGFPSFEDRMYAVEANIRTYREAIEAGVSEVYRLKRELDKDRPGAEPGAPEGVR